MACPAAGERFVYTSAEGKKRGLFTLRAFLQSLNGARLLYGRAAPADDLSSAAQHDSPAANPWQKYKYKSGHAFLPLCFEAGPESQYHSRCQSRDAFCRN